MASSTQALGSLAHRLRALQHAIALRLDSMVILVIWHWMIVCGTDHWTVPLLTTTDHLGFRYYTAILDPTLLPSD